MSKNYELNNRDPQACQFGGNGTVNPLAPTSASAADAAASSCIATPGAVFTPSGVASGPNQTGGSSPRPSGTGNNNNNNNAAMSLFGDSNSLLGLAVVGVVGLLSGIWTMA